MAVKTRKVRVASGGTGVKRSTKTTGAKAPVRVPKKK